MVVVGSIDARFPSTLFIAQAYGKSVAFPDATALCRGVAAGERENPFVSWVSAAVNVNTTKAHESTSPRLRLTPRHSSTRGTRGTWPFASRVTSFPNRILPVFPYFLTFPTYSIYLFGLLSLFLFFSLSSFLSIFFYRFNTFASQYQSTGASQTVLRLMCIMSGR